MQDRLKGLQVPAATAFLGCSPSTWPDQLGLCQTSCGSQVNSIRWYKKECLIFISLAFRLAGQIEQLVTKMQGVYDNLATYLSEATVSPETFGKILRSNRFYICSMYNCITCGTSEVSQAQGQARSDPTVLRAMHQT